MYNKKLLVKMACKKANTHPSELWRFTVANTPSLRYLSLAQMVFEYKEQTAPNGEWSDDMLDTCLKVLAGRIPLWVRIPEQGEIYIIRPTHHLLATEKWKDGEGEEWQESDSWG